MKVTSRAENGNRTLRISGKHGSEINLEELGLILCKRLVLNLYFIYTLIFLFYIFQERGAGESLNCHNSVNTYFKDIVHFQVIFWVTPSIVKLEK